MVSIRPPSKRSIPHLLIFLGRHCAIGVSVGFLLLFLLIFFNALGLGDLLQHSQDRWIALALLAGGFGITFGSLAMGTAIFLLPRHQDNVPPGGFREVIADRNQFNPVRQPAPAVIRPRRR